MRETVYNDDSGTDYHISSDFYGEFQNLRDALDKVETERDSLLCLLHEVSEADGEDELEEILLRVKEITENRPNPLPY